MALEPFRLAESSARREFEPDLYAHLDRLAGVEFGRRDPPRRNFVFTFEKYTSLQQAAFEDGVRIEGKAPSAVNWAEVDAHARLFREQLRVALHGSQDAYESVVDFCTEAYENWLTYREMYPEPKSNPWSAARESLRKGRLFLVTSDPDEVQDLTGSKHQSKALAGARRLAVVIKARASKPTSFVIDERHTLQHLVLRFLRKHASGHKNPVSLKEIQRYLREEGEKLSVPTIQIRLTVPLKKSGAVGSSSKGYFYISEYEDLVVSYCFHRSKIVSIRRIMGRYERRALAEFGGFDLEAECSGEILNGFV